MTYNPILDADSYKASHFLFYPPDVTRVYSYGESRGGRYPETLFFGLQPLLHQMQKNPVKLAHVEEAADFAKAHGVPFNAAGWYRIVDKHDGFLPLEIKAAPEGSLIPTRNVLVTVENADPELPWLTSYVETALLRQVWYPTTVATRVFNMKRRIKAYFEATSDDLSNLPFALLDFSSRGCASYGANEIGGAAYLANFMGSDSMPAVRYVNEHYGSPMSGFSVPATEHSIMCSWGNDGKDTVRAMIAKLPPGSTISIVADTWNVFEFAQTIAEMAPEFRAAGVKVVVRPDSGKMSKQVQTILGTLADGFGYSVNKKGYCVINGAKMLWGDGIDENTCIDPFLEAVDIGYSADSIMVGSGGGLMQSNIDRDTCKFAFKASAIERSNSGTYEGIAKDPITDPGKKSKMGRLALTRTGNSWETVYPDKAGGAPEIYMDELRTVYRNGSVMNETTIDAVRKLVDSQL